MKEFVGLKLRALLEATKPPDPQEQEIIKHLAYLAAMHGVSKKFGYAKVSPITYAHMTGIRPSDLTAMITLSQENPSTLQAKVDYHGAKLMNAKGRLKKIEDEIANAAKVPLRAPLPSEEELIAGLKNGTIDWSYYGDHLTQEEWIELFADVLYRAHKLAPQTEKEIKEQLWAKMKEVSEQYGIHYGALMSWMIFHTKEVDKAMDLADSFDKPVVAPHEPSGQTVVVEPEPFKPAPWVRPVKAISQQAPSTGLTGWPHAHKPFVMVVGGLERDIPQWIKSSFEVKHFPRSDSPTKIVNTLGERIPDAVLVLRWVDHEQANKVTAIASQHHRPILVAKPAISSAVKQAEAKGPSWFSDAYHKSLKEHLAENLVTPPGNLKPNEQDLIDDAENLCKTQGLTYTDFCQKFEDLVTSTKYKLQEYRFHSKINHTSLFLEHYTTTEGIKVKVHIYHAISGGHATKQLELHASIETLENPTDQDVYYLSYWRKA
jgi:hypothetical protein